MQTATRLHQALFTELPYRLIDRETLLEILQGDRQALKRILRTRQLRAVAQGIYVLPLVPGYRMVGGPPPSPALVAESLARRHQWRLIVSRECARYLCGLRERPVSLEAIGYDQPVERRFHHFIMQPENPEIASLTAVSQCVRVALDQESGWDDDELSRIGRQLAVTLFFRDQRADLETERDRLGAAGERALDAMLRHLAEVEDPSWPLTSAPPGWVPPTQEGCKVHDWQIVHCPSDAGTTYHLRAAAITGHPNIADYRPLTYSSQLIWLDFERGWARTLSRIYRLGTRAPHD